MTSGLRWDKRGLPHKGWQWISVERLAEAAHTCEMCGKTDIRYVHTVTHPEGHIAEVGCDCAERLTDDYVNPLRREQELKNREGRRKRLPGRRWTKTANGNPTLVIEGKRIVVFKKVFPERTACNFVVYHRHQQKEFGPRWFSTQVEAMQAAFDAADPALSSSSR